MMNEILLTVCPRPNLLNLIQKTAASVEDMSSVENYDGSTHQNPPPPAMDRQELSPNALAELRDACTVLARDVSIAAQILEDSRNRRESNTKPKKEENSAKQSSHTRTSKSESQGRSSRRRDDSNLVSDPPPYTRGPYVPCIYVPVSATTSVRSTTSHKNLLSTQDANVIDPDPLALVRMPKSRGQVNPVHQAARLGPNVLGRPVTSAGVSGDHLGSSLDASHYTSRTATTFDQPSTRLSSWSSPANERKSSPGSNYVSEQISPDRLSTSAAGVAAKTWMMQELAHRRPEPSSGRTAVRPGSSGVTPYKNAGTDRPGSRAGTIAGNVKDTIRDYMRPRPSSDTVHTTRSETYLARVNSRRGQESHGGGTNWWRGSGLGSGKNWSSFRNTKTDDECPSGTEGSPNLNRELPALPGLDQYRERKPSATHVAQLMRAERATPKKTSEPPRHGQNPINHKALVESENIRHKEAVQQAMEDRMRHHTRMASATFGLYARQKEHAARKRAQAATAMKTSPSTQIQDVPTVPAVPNRPRGLRNRVSRFLGRGEEK